MRFGNQIFVVATFSALNGAAGNVFDIEIKSRKSNAHLASEIYPECYPITVCSLPLKIGNALPSGSETTAKWPKDMLVGRTTYFTVFLRDFRYTGVDAINFYGDHSMGRRIGRLLVVAF